MAGTYSKLPMLIEVCSGGYTLVPGVIGPSRLLGTVETPSCRPAAEKGGTKEPPYASDLLRPKVQPGDKQEQGTADIWAPSPKQKGEVMLNTRGGVSCNIIGKCR